MTASTSITSSVTGYQIDRQTTNPWKYFWGQDLNLYVLLWQHRAVRSQSETLVIETRAKVPPGGSSLWNVFNGLTWISCLAEPVQRATEITELEDIDFSLRWSMQKFWKRWIFWVMFGRMEEKSFPPFSCRSSFITEDKCLSVLWGFNEIHFFLHDWQEQNQGILHFN